MEKRYFEFHGADAKRGTTTSSKFWEVWIDGSTLYTRFGKIGANGQTTVKEFPTPEKAEAALEKAAAEKTKKGYIDGSARETLANRETQGDLVKLFDVFEIPGNFGLRNFEMSKEDAETIRLLAFEFADWKDTFEIENEFEDDEFDAVEVIDAEFVWSVCNSDNSYLVAGRLEPDFESDTTVMSWITTKRKWHVEGENGPTTDYWLGCIRCEEAGSHNERVCQNCAGNGGNDVDLSFPLVKSRERPSAPAHLVKNKTSAEPDYDPGGGQCNSCSKQLPIGAKFCSSCGEEVSSGPALCSQCGAKRGEGAKFCGQCGNNLVKLT